MDVLNNKVKQNKNALVCVVLTFLCVSRANDLDKDIILIEKVKNIIEHYKQHKPVGLPEVPIPDPLPIPGFESQIKIGTIKFANAAVYNLSKFTIEKIDADLVNMTVKTEIFFSNLQMNGVYSYNSWLRASTGDFTINLDGVRAEATASIHITQMGSLQADDIQLDLSFVDITMDFDNAGFIGNFLQGIVNSMGATFFGIMKDTVFAQVNTMVKSDINQQMRDLPIQFPNSISLLDKIIADVRQVLRERELDPMDLPDQEKHVGSMMPIAFRLKSGFLKGLATLHRVGNTSLHLSDNILMATIHAGLNNLEGGYEWEAAVTRFYSREGNLKFSIQNTQIIVQINRPLNLDKPTCMKSLKILLGNIQITSSGAGTIDYFLEFLINAIPNLIRNEITSLLESTFIHLINQELQKHSVEGIILSILEEQGTKVNKL